MSITAVFETRLDQGAYVDRYKEEGPDVLPPSLCL